MAYLTVTYYEEHTIPLVHFPEKATMANVTEIQDELRLLTMGGTKIIADLAGTYLVDSSGLALFVKNRECISSILSPTANVWALFELTRLNEFFAITNSVKAATEYYKSQQ